MGFFLFIMLGICKAFLNLWYDDVFHHFWKILSCYLFKHCSWHFPLSPPGPLITHMLDLTAVYISCPVFCIAVHLSFLLFSDSFFWPNIVHRFVRLKLSSELFPLVIIFSNSDASVFFFFIVSGSLSKFCLIFYFFYFLECGSTITLKSLAMTISRISVGPSPLCVDFSVFLFFSILLYIPFALVFFIVLWGIVFSKLLA